jgi:hypothetical protein
MNAKTSKEEQPPGRSTDSKDPVSKAGTGTEAERKGGVEPAKRQAERDWQDSAKESGD